MDCTIAWQGVGTMAFDATTGTGHGITLDGPAQYGGENKGARPMEMLLVGAGGCTAFDVVMILQKGRKDVTGCSIKITSERATQDPKVFTKIHLHFDITGSNLSEKVVERAIALSHDKFCSATIMLGKTADISTSFTITADSA